MSDALAWLTGLLAVRFLGTARGGPEDMVFFQQINDFLRDEIDEFAVHLLGRTATWLGSIVLSLVTLWIMLQGYRIVTGQSRESMTTLVSGSLRAVLVISIATAAAAGSSSAYGALTDGLSTQVSKVVTGHDEDPYERIDESLWYMQAAMGVIDAVQVADDPIANDNKDRALWFAGLGTAGPALTGGTMLLLNKIAMALFVGLGPLFILCLLFEPTKPLFGRWLYYGIGTMFSLAVLSVMVTLALDMVLAVAAAFWTTDALELGSEGLLSLSMQQGGMGLVLTMLIISAPPMAAMFFQGTLGHFSSHNAFGGNGTAGVHRIPAAMPPMVAAAPPVASVSGALPSVASPAAPPMPGAPAFVQADAIKRTGAPG